MNKFLKLILAVLILAGAVYLFMNGSVWWGILLVVLALVSVVLYFFNEYILLAFFRLRKQDLEGAGKWLDKIKNTKTQLSKTQLGYFHYMKGITKSQGNLNEAEKHMRQALSHGLAFGHDKAMAKMNIATGMLRKGNKKEAKRLLKEARKDDKRGMVASQIDMIEQQIKKVNVSKNPRQQQIQRRGRFF